MDLPENLADQFVDFFDELVEALLLGDEAVGAGAFGQFGQFVGVLAGEEDDGYVGGVVLGFQHLADLVAADVGHVDVGQDDVRFEIAELLCEEGCEISLRTVERVLVEEGFPKLPRRTRLKIGQTVDGADVPDRSGVVSIAGQEGRVFESTGAGVFVFAPFLSQLNFDRVLKEFVPDIILTDVNMPDIRGDEICKVLKTKYDTADIPIVLFSSKDTDELAELAERAGADGFVSKQQGFDTLIEKIDELVDDILW